MVKEKKSKESLYMQQLSGRYKEIQKDKAIEELRKKGVLIGDGYNVKKLKSEYRKEKIKENIDKIGRKIYKKLQERVISRKILKPNQMTVHIKEYKPESPWEEDNKFFRGNFAKEKRSMFFE